MSKPCTADGNQHIVMYVFDMWTMKSTLSIWEK